MTRTALRCLVAVLLAGRAGAAFEQALDPRLIDEARAVGQSRLDAIRARYHQPYRIHVARAPVDYIEIVTPFRRVALLAEEQVRAGNRVFGQREAVAALGDRSTVVEILIEMTFHPLNVFVGMPAYDVGLDTASPVTRLTPLQVSRTPRFGARVEGVAPSSPSLAAPNGPRGSQPMAGGTVAATFRAAALGPNGVYDVVISEQGKELARTRVNLGILR